MGHFASAFALFQRSSLGLLSPYVLLFTAILYLLLGTRARKAKIARKRGIGLKQVVRGKGSGFDIIFVHGLGSEQAKAWSTGNICWPEDLLPDNLHHDAKAKPNTGIYLYGYDSSWMRDAAVVGIRDLASGLLDAIENNLKPNRRLIFVAHSHGGLVVKDAIVASLIKSRIDPSRFGGFLFLGTPHRGSGISRLGKFIASLLTPFGADGSILTSLDIDSDFLLELHSNFVSALGSSPPPIINFYEGRRTVVAKLLGFHIRAMVVTKASATFEYQSCSNILLQRDHKALNKFTERDADYGLVLSALQQCLDARRSELKDQEQARIACFRSLAFARMDARMEDIVRPEDRTCNWLFKTQEYRRWLYREDLTSHNGVFWIQGHPGAGKSTLMKHLVLQCRHQDWTMATFFFNTRGDKDECSPIGMYRSLVWHLADRNPATSDALLELYQSNIKKFGQFAWRQSMLQDFIRADLQRHSRILLVVDALDECHEKDVAEVVAFLESLSLEALNLGVPLNIALSSRHYPIIDMKVRELLMIDAHPEHIKDIKTYIDNRLRVPAMSEQLLLQSNGVFMWIVLVVEMLNKANREGRVRELRDILDGLPSDLDDLYSALMRTYKIDERYTLPIYMWILFSEELLTPAELYAALMMEKNGKVQDQDGLVEISSDDTVQFIHKTVPDFLQRQGRLTRLDERFQSVPESCYDHMAQICEKYIESFAALSKRAESKLWSHFSSKYSGECTRPFLRHAATSLIVYSEKAHASGVKQGRLLTKLQDEAFYETCVALYERYNAPVHAWGPASLLYFLASFDAASQMETLIHTGTEAYEHGGYHGTALHVAAAEGKARAVEVLLRCGAPVDDNSGELGTSLRAASIWGRTEVVKLLLAAGANPLLQTMGKNSPLEAAEGACHKEIVELMKASLALKEESLQG